VTAADLIELAGKLRAMLPRVRGYDVATVQQAALELEQVAWEIRESEGAEPRASEVVCRSCGGAFQWDHRVEPPTRCFRCALAPV